MVKPKRTSSSEWQLPRTLVAAQPPRRRAWLALALLVPGLAWPGIAGATPDYPLAIDITLQLNPQCPSPNSRCLICHTTNRGGQGTAVQVFARALRRYGLNRGRDAGALQAALTALPDDTDSDEDGVSDKEELMGCGNPSGEDLGVGPEYGCDGARLAPPPADGERPLAAVLSLLCVGSCALLLRRGAPRSRP